VISLQKELTADSSTAAAVLMGAVGFLLLIACANVANLFLARAVARRKEIATRIALGATRRDIVRMLITESLLLGMAGGVLGTTFLVWGRRAILFLIPKTLPQGIPIDWHVLAFTAACSIAAGLLFGLAPALEASRVEVNSGLKETGVRSRSLLPAVLTAGQIALSLVLLVGAGLMIRTFLLVAYMDPGFDAHNVLMATANLRPFEAYSEERQVQFFSRMLAGIQRLPGIRYAAVTSAPPMAPFSELNTGMYIDNEPRVDDAVSVVSVSPEYFKALGIHLVAGRFFDARDNRGGPKVAIVSQALARLLFQSRNPVGHRINYPATVVGVVADIRHLGLDKKVWPELYLPFEQSPQSWVTVLVRGYGDPSALAPAIRSIAASVDPTQPIFDVGLLEDHVSKSLAERRERAAVLGAFAALALLIAVVGIYGVISYSVARRTHEIGVRMALGARESDVLHMVLIDGLRIAACGIAIGLPGAFFLMRLLTTFLYGVVPADLTTFSLVCLILAIAAFLATYLPARRAARTDPMAALRAE